MLRMFNKVFIEGSKSNFTHREKCLGALSLLRTKHQA